MKDQDFDFVDEDEDYEDIEISEDVELEDEDIGGIPGSNNKTILIVISTVALMSLVAILSLIVLSPFSFPFTKTTNATESLKITTSTGQIKIPIESFTGYVPDMAISDLSVLSTQPTDTVLKEELYQNIVVNFLQKGDYTEELTTAALAYSTPTMIFISPTETLLTYQDTITMTDISETQLLSFGVFDTSGITKFKAYTGDILSLGVNVMVVSFDDLNTEEVTSFVESLQSINSVPTVLPAVFEQIESSDATQDEGYAETAVNANDTQATEPAVEQDTQTLEIVSESDTYLYSFGMNKENTVTYIEPVANTEPVEIYQAYQFNSFIGTIGDVSYTSGEQEVLLIPNSVLIRAESGEFQLVGMLPQETELTGATGEFVGGKTLALGTYQIIEGSVRIYTSAPQVTVLGEDLTQSSIDEIAIEGDTFAVNQDSLVILDNATIKLQ